MELHDKQRQVVESKARFKVVRAGRRSGKTILKQETMLFKASINRAVTKAKLLGNRAVIFIAPTQKQARTIVWEAFKSRLGKIGEYNESRLEIKLPTEDGGQATIFIGGWENRENYRGMPNVIHLEFDELDTMKDFFIGWQEIFRPMLIDTGGSAGFGGTPKKENPNLRRLEKEAENNPDWACFHFTTYDNPHVPHEEIEAARATMDNDTFRQEIMAEYVENAGSLFRYTSILDVFSNALTKRPQRYLIIDVADDGSDKTKFSFWEDLEEYRRDTFSGLNSEAIIAQTREYQQQERIPMSNTLVDAIGVGAAVASSSFLDGIVGFKSSYAPLRTEKSIVALPNVHYRKDAPLTSDYANLRSQCVFTLADHVNRHLIASKTTGRDKENIIEELATYQDASKGDGKRFATPKEDVSAIIGRSPDDSDTWIMRMYFVLRETLSPHQNETDALVSDTLIAQFRRNESSQDRNDTR
jgi:hypothetical protein